MNQRGSVNVIVMIIVVVLLGVGAYVVAMKEVAAPVSTPTPVFTPKASPTPTQTPLPTSTPTPSPTLESSPLFTPTPIPSGETITKKIGEQESTFTIQKINSDSVEGLWYNNYPIARIEGTPRTLKIGDDIGYACEGVSEKLTGIDFVNQTAIFTKVVGAPPMGGCPICLAGNTLIDTPSGAVAVKNMEIGMPVWTSDASGQRIAGTVVRTSKVPVPPTHQMVHLILDNGRELFVSPGHPTTDGRTVGEIIKNDLYDGAQVISSERVPYDEGATYDILPSGGTGFYWANGILLGSTLR